MNQQNPYEPPSSSLKSTESRDEPQITLRAPRAVPVARALGWISEAFAFFRAHPVPWAVTGLVLLALSITFSLLPMFGGAANTLFSTLILGGVMMGCAAQEMGEEYTLGYLSVGLSRWPKLLAFALIYLALSYGVLVFSLGTFGLQMIMGQVNAETFDADLAANSRGVLIALLLMMPVMMATWFGVVLIVLHDVSVPEALKLSFEGCLRNLLPVLVFAIVMGVLFFIAVLPLLLGLFIMYPLMLIANYTAYRDIFTHETAGTP